MLERDLALDRDLRRDHGTEGVTHQPQRSNGDRAHGGGSGIDQLIQRRGIGIAAAMAGEVDGEDTQAALGKAPRQQSVGVGIGEQSVDQERVATPLSDRWPFAHLDGASDGGDLDRACRGRILGGSGGQDIVAADAAVASTAGERGQIDAAVARKPAGARAGAQVATAG